MRRYVGVGGALAVLLAGLWACGEEAAAPGTRLLRVRLSPATHLRRWRGYRPDWDTPMVVR